MFSVKFHQFRDEGDQELRTVNRVSILLMMREHDRVRIRYMSETVIQTCDGQPKI